MMEGKFWGGGCGVLLASRCGTRLEREAKGVEFPLHHGAMGPSSRGDLGDRGARGLAGHPSPTQGVENGEHIAE